MLSLFEITLGNWVPVCRLLIENVSEYFMAVCLLHKLTIGFAVVAVINGVFMQETFKCAASDDRIMVRQKEQALKVFRQKMNMLFKQMDQNGDETVSLEEFGDVMADKTVKNWLASMELDAFDVVKLFNLLDKGSGKVNLDEVIQG